MTATDPFARLERALALVGAPSSDFDLNPEVTPTQGRKLRPAGVLVAVEKVGDTARLWLTKRSSALRHHPGQVAFPGGKRDPEDADDIAAALREAEEEIGLPRDKVEVMGTLPTHETVTGFAMTPVVARVTTSFTPVAELGEVSEVFSVPLDHVTQSACYCVQSRRWRGRQRQYFAAPYGPYYIWGATARILHGLAQRMEQ